MALSATALAALIRSKALLPVNASLGATDNPALTTLCKVIAEAVVEHLQSAAAVSVVTTCGAGAGTGTGTVT